MALTLVQNAERIKNCIDAKIDPATQKTLVNLYKTTLGSILTECENIYKGPNFTTSESYAASSANFVLNGQYSNKIDSVYELHKALYTAQQYNLPYECKDIIKDAYTLLNSAVVNSCTTPDTGASIVTTASEMMGDLYHETMNTI